MSGFIGAAQPSFVHGLQDLRLHGSNYQQLGAIFAECVNAQAQTMFTSEWWPGSGLIGNAAVDVGILEGGSWGVYYPAGGDASRYGFVGVTRDSLGTPVGSCTVKLFLTSTDLLLDTTVSDPSGNFLLNTAFYPDFHYMVAHKTGSPDIDGASVNTLIGT